MANIKGWKDSGKIVRISTRLSSGKSTVSKSSTKNKPNEDDRIGSGDNSWSSSNFSPRGGAGAKSR